MATPNDSIAVTPGSGVNVATQLVGGVEIQNMIPTDANGHMVGSIPTWVAQTGLVANSGGGNVTKLDIFNAVGSGVILTVHGLFLIPSLAAVTGVGLSWSFDRTTSVGTGGTTLTPRPMDTANAALPAGVTARTAPTGGAAVNYTLLTPQSSSEETSPYAATAGSLNHLGIVGDDWLQEPTLREGQGFRVVQVTGSNIGQTNILVLFTVE